MSNGYLYKSIAIISAAAVILGGCGSSKAEEAGRVYGKNSIGETMAMYDSVEEMPAYEEYDDSSAAEYENGIDTTTTENANTSNRKLIKTVNLTVETLEFDKLVKNLEDTVVGYGGYIENMDGNYGSIYGSYSPLKQADLTVRIPSGKLDAFVNGVDKEANITNKSTSVEDVTLNYVDMESHKKMLVEQQNRLMELLENAETIEDIIAIESRLSDVKYQIESMESQLRTYDNKIDYSTVYISVREVEEYKEIENHNKSVAERIADGFKKNLKNVWEGIVDFIVWLISSLPVIIIWLVVLFVLYKLFRLFRRWWLENNEKARLKDEKRRARKEEKRAKKQALKDKKNNKTEENTVTTEDAENK